jgi:choline dehydrogenase
VVDAYDTIIVGGGSAGGILARLLSDSPGARVLVIEAGPDLPSSEQLPPELRDARFPQLLAYDWGERAWQTEMPGRATEHYPRGKVVGGSSTTNGAVAQRGRPEDYDRWLEAGNPGWGWDDVLPTFVRMEHDLDFVSDVHGAAGRVPVTRWPTDIWPRLLTAARDEMVSRGIPWMPDQNAPDATGIGPIPRNQLGTLRGGSLVAYLSDVRGRPNLTVLAETEVRRLLVDGHRVLGVAVDGPRGREEILGHRVIMSAGVFRSPHLMMLSGIGPRRELELAGITCVQDLPGVGRNLRDHPRVPLVAVPRDDHGQRGMLAEVRRTSSLGVRNDLAVSISTMSAETLASMDFGIQTRSAVAMLFSATVALPRSAGWIDLDLEDPQAPPVIHLNMLSDRDDIVRLREITRLTADVLTAPDVSAHVEQHAVPSDAVLRDDALLDEWLYASVKTAYHGSGTCRMGPVHDPLAVVDHRLKVHGMDNLYVVDASVMPEAPCHYTGLTTYMIAEHAAVWLRGGDG